MSARVLSALVLAPPVVAAFYFGSPYSDGLLILAGAVLAWEWSRICGGATLGWSGVLVILVVTAALTAGALGAYAVAAWVIAAGSMAAAVAALGTGRDQPSWYALGVVYIALPCLAVMWLRRDPHEGRAVILWLLVLVWATDIGAYFTGRALGGPRLAPAISPNKTWSGLFGGMAAAALVGVVAALLRENWAPLAFAVLSALLAIVAQGGDLVESSVKRHFGVKDASALIPGHGGLLDRVDGLLSVGLTVAAVVWLMEDWP